MADADAETGAARDAAREMSSGEALRRLRECPQDSQLIEVILRFLAFNLTPKNTRPTTSELCRYAQEATAELRSLIGDARSGSELKAQLSKLHKKIAFEFHPDRAGQRKGEIPLWMVGIGNLPNFLAVFNNQRVLLASLNDVDVAVYI